ncbi:MAG: ImmA/IrrE family metallo-endopeptidase [Mucilaginibacter sp.]
MKNTLFAVIISFLGINFANAQCKISFEQGVARHLITPDLFNTAINYQQFICPTYFQGDTTQCGTITDARDKWNAGLPDGLIFTAIFNASEYAIIKPILQDSFFLDAIAKVPSPSKEALEWFNNRKIANEMVIPLENDTVHNGHLDAIQTKMITVFYSIRSWTFCPEVPTADDGGLMRGRFDTTSRKLVVYKDACLADKVYDLDINSAALAFRLFFVTAHELGHVVDLSSGKLAAVYLTEAEDRANLFGLIMTEAFAKLVNIHLNAYQKAIHAYDKVLPCDVAYIDRAVQTWSHMDQYFVGRITEAKALLNANPSVQAISRIQQNWIVFACMQRPGK